MMRRSYLCTSKNGQSTVMFAVMLSIFLGLMALGVDAVSMYAERRRAQAVADMAAMAGSLLVNGTGAGATSAINAAQTIITANGYTSGTGSGQATICINPYYVAGSNVCPSFASSGGSGAIEVTIMYHAPTIFANIMSLAVTDVLGRTVALRSQDNHMAIYSNSTDSNNPYGVDLTGCNNCIIGGRIHSRCDLRAQNQYTVSLGITYDGVDSACNARIVNNTSATSYSLNTATTWPITAPITNLSNYPCDFDRQGPVPTNWTSPARKPYANELSSVPPTTGAAALRHTGDFDLSTSSGTNGTWWQNSPTNTILKSGVYCVQDGALKWTGGGNGPYSGNVTFILAGTSNQVQVNPFNPNNFTVTPYKDQMLIFSQGTSTAVSLGGSGGTWSGYIYAPSTGASISLTGNGTNSLTGALYGDNVNISGGGWTLTGTGPSPSFFQATLTE